VEADKEISPDTKQINQDARFGGGGGSRDLHIDLTELKHLLHVLTFSQV